jgi:hypothetical protein
MPALPLSKLIISQEYGITPAKTLGFASSDITFPWIQISYYEPNPWLKISEGQAKKKEASFLFLASAIKLNRE